MSSVKSLFNRVVQPGETKVHTSSQQNSPSWINQSKVIPTFETNLASLGVITVSNRHLSALIFPGFLYVHVLLATSFPDRPSLGDIL